MMGIVEGTLAIVGGEGGGKVTGGFFRQMLRAPLLSLLSGQRLRPLVRRNPSRTSKPGMAAPTRG
jgi:hypothetical protein